MGVKHYWIDPHKVDIEDLGSSELQLLCSMCYQL